MTHRHADHIAGFDRASERFKDFKGQHGLDALLGAVNDAERSAHRLQADIEELALQLGMQFRGRTDEAAGHALDLLWNATGIDFNAAAGGGKRRGGNARALDLLKNHLGNNGKNVRYYAAGDKPELPPEIKGLSAEILGPPPDEAQAFLKLEDLKVGVGQYRDSTTGSETGVQPFRQQWRADGTKITRLMTHGTTPSTIKRSSKTWAEPSPTCSQPPL
jgi:hypothetical protein